MESRVTIEDVLAILGEDGDVPDRPVRGWISHGDQGWEGGLATLVGAWRDWRGDRPVEVTATVRGAPTVVELEVGARAAPATLLWDERPVPPELRIYVDPQDAA